MCLMDILTLPHHTRTNINVLLAAFSIHRQGSWQVSGTSVAIPARWTRAAAPRPVPKQAQILGCGPKVGLQSHGDGNYAAVSALCSAVRFPLAVPSLGLCSSPRPHMKKAHRNACGALVMLFRRA